MKQLASKSLLILFTSLLCFVNQQVTLAADNTNDTGICSNHCSIEDEDASCWNQTQHYYDINLINALNDWMMVQIRFDFWYHRKYHTSDLPPDANETTVARLSQLLPSGSILNSDHLRQIVPSLLDMVSSHLHPPSVQESGIGLPEFVCPIPCGYDSQLWQYLFVASILVNIAMLLVVIPFIIKSERRDKKLYAKQVSMMQMLKPSSKSRNPSSS